MLLKAWSPDHQYQNDVGTYLKHKVLCPTPDIINQKFWGLGPSASVLTSPQVILTHANIWEPPTYTIPPTHWNRNSLLQGTEQNLSVLVSYRDPVWLFLGNDTGHALDQLQVDQIRFVRRQVGGTLTDSTQLQKKSSRKKLLPPLPCLALLPDYFFPQLTPGKLGVTEYK